MNPVANASAIAQRRHPGCVLLAEDDDAMRSLLAACLRKDGYKVVEARDGEHLCRLLGMSWVHPPSLVISDVRMPGCTGLKALDEMRKRDWETVVVLITAFGDSKTRDRARQLGAAEVLDKPLDLDDLRAVVRRLLTPPPEGPDGWLVAAGAGAGE